MKKECLSILDRHSFFVASLGTHSQEFFEYRQTVHRVRAAFLAAHPLRVELDAQDGQALVEHTLHDAALRPEQRLQPLPQPVHPLVVMAVHREMVPPDFLKPAPRRGMDRVGLVVGQRIIVGVEKSHRCGNVLDQSPTQGDVHNLVPPADAQDGLSGLQIGLNEVKFRPVPVQVDILGAAVLLPKPGAGGELYGISG